MRKELNIPSGVISYLTMGQGEPLFMLSGYGGNFYTWPLELKEKLSQKFQLFFLNYREIGFSFAHDNAYSIPFLAQDLHYFIEQMQFKKYSLLGFSMGGYVAQEFALNYRKNLDLLILCATRLGGYKSIQTATSIIKQTSFLSLEEEVESDLALNFPHDVHDKFRASQYERRKLCELPEGFASSETRVRQGQSIQQWMLGFNEEKYLKYSEISARKTLLLAGLKDKITPYQNSIVLSEHIKNSQVILFDNGGHGFLRQYPREVAQIINSQMQ